MQHASNIVEAHKLRCKLGLQKNKIEEELVQCRSAKFGDLINLQEFTKILRLDATDLSAQQLFRIYDKTNCGRIDLAEYLFTVIAIAKANSVLDLVGISFEVCDSNGMGYLDSEELRKVLRLSLQLEPEDSDTIFLQATRDVGGKNSVNLGKYINKAKM